MRPLSLNTRRALVSAVVLATGVSISQAQPVVNGTLAGDESAYGTIKSTQLVGTQFGNSATIPGPNPGDPPVFVPDPLLARGSELNGAFATVANGNLYLLLTGNLETNFNKLELFIDAIPGGQNTLRGDNPDVDFNGLNRMGNNGTDPGLTFDAAFSPDYYLTFTGGNNPAEFFANYAELLTDGRGNGVFIGGAPAGTGVLTGSNGINIAINNINDQGVASLGETFTSDPATVLTGIEFEIPLRLLGNSNQDIRVTAAINGSGHDFFSNQFLGALPDGTGNLGEPRIVNLEVDHAGDQFFGAGAGTGNRWAADASGTFSTGASWTSGSAPTGATQIASFTAPLTANRTVTVDASETLNYIEFNPGTAADGYVLESSNTPTAVITLEGFSRRALRNLSGVNTILTPVVLNKNAAVEVLAGSSLTLGNLTAAGQFVDIVGGGVFAVDKLVAAGSELRGNSTLRINSASGDANASKVSFLSVNLGSVVDLTNAQLIIDYNDVDPSPFAGYLAVVQGGGITSSLLDSSRGIAIGESVAITATEIGGLVVDATSLVIRMTLLGDATMDGAVNFEDLLRLAQSYNQPEKVWTDGDFDYSGTVDFADLLSLAQNYNESLTSDQAAALGGAFASDWSLALSLVPEPASLGMLSLAAVALVRRRR